MGVQEQIELDLGALSAMMPMHLVVSNTGHITHAGPTISKLRDGAELVGQRLFEVFEFRRPSSAFTIANLVENLDVPLSLVIRDAPSTGLKGIAALLPARRGVLLNLSFGISVVDAVGSYNLTNQDFAPTDLAIEMLYLSEARAAVMGESRNLNMRLQGAKIAAEEQAFTDTLTGLKNRRALDHVLRRLTEAKAPFAMMNLDLDYFKAVNDTYGHAAGDSVLQHVAKILIAEMRSDDLVARVGGDEFVLIIDGEPDAPTLMKIASRIIEKLEVPVAFEGNECRISGSIGIATAKSDVSVDIDRLTGLADTALYQSKDNGRGQATMAAAMGS